MTTIKAEIWRAVLLRHLAVEDWSQVDLAKQMKICPVTVSAYMTGRREPSAKMLWRVSRAISVPLRELAQEAQKKSAPVPPGAVITAEVGLSAPNILRKYLRSIKVNTSAPAVLINIHAAFFRMYKRQIRDETQQEELLWEILKASCGNDEKTLKQVFKGMGIPSATVEMILGRLDGIGISLNVSADASDALIGRIRELIRQQPNEMDELNWFVTRREALLNNPRGTGGDPA